MASASLGKVAPHLNSLTKPFVPHLNKADVFACATLDGVASYTQTSLASGRTALASVVDIALLPSLSDLFSSPIETTLVTAERLVPEPESESEPGVSEGSLAATPAAAAPVACAPPSRARRALRVSTRATRLATRAAVAQLTALTLRSADAVKAYTSVDLLAYASAARDSPAVTAVAKWAADVCDRTVVLATPLVASAQQRSPELLAKLAEAVARVREPVQPLASAAWGAVSARLMLLFAVALNFILPLADRVRAALASGRGVKYVPVVCDGFDAAGQDDEAEAEVEPEAEVEAEAEDESQNEAEDDAAVDTEDAGM